MATLEQVFNRDLILPYLAADPIRNTALWASGAFASDNRISRLIASGSQTFTVPYIMDIDGNLEANYSNTILTDIAMPRGIEAGSMSGKMAYLNESFIEAQLTKALSSVSPMQEIAKQIDGLWGQQAENRAVATIMGMLNSDQATADKPLTYDISKATADATSKFTVDAFIDVEATMPRKYRGVGALVVHPKVLALMEKQSELATDVDPATGLTLTRYRGRVIVETDQGTVIGTGANAKYVLGFLGTSSFAAESVANSRDMKLAETEATGNGGGHSILHTRRDMLIQPMGFSFDVNATLTGGTKNEALSASWSDLTKAENWEMVLTAEKVPFRFLICNI